VEAEAKKVRCFGAASAFLGIGGENQNCPPKSLSKIDLATYDTLTKISQCQMGVKSKQCQMIITLKISSKRLFSTMAETKKTFETKCDETGKKKATQRKANYEEASRIVKCKLRNSKKIVVRTEPVVRSIQYTILVRT